MKHSALYIFLALALLMGSCESWVDVTPNDRETEDVLFKSKEGYEKALNGVYVEMNNTSLYGRNMTAGAIDVLAQYYTNFGSSTHRYYKLWMMDYTDSDIKQIFEDIWQKTYNIIADVNVILEHCDNNDGNLKAPYANMIKGEAYALRAMLHFDMLRLFGPVPSQLGNTAIPYQTSGNVEVTSLLTGNEVIAKVEDDLKQAITLLADSDPYLSDDKTAYDDVDVTYRQFRLNYYACEALLARVYLWAGDKTNAYNMATGVIKANDANQLFPFVTNAAATNASNPDRVFSTEVLFACYNSLREDDIYNYLFSPTLEQTSLFTFAGSLTDGRVNSLYDDKNDYRYRNWGVYNNQGEDVLYNRKYEPISSSGFINAMVPLIRLSEMYLIAAECAPDIATANEYFNTLRHARNCLSITLTEETKMNYIEQEYRKEMIGEGQMFFFYKRNEQVAIPDGKQVSGYYNVPTDKYVIPLPESETDQRIN